VLRDRVRLRDWHDTLSITANALQDSDDCALDHRVRAFALERLGRHDEAIAQYELAIHYDPTDADTYYDYANLLFRDGHLQESLAMYVKAIALRPLRAEFHHNYAVALMSAGEKSQAGLEFSKAVRLDPASDQARNDYSRWLQLQK
jgi:tetratricopeptide (TPR) repeat protein